jgi:predicted Fe-Mo cluster-binding NifX family protein
MKIVISADGYTLDAPASQVFGRCPAYVFVDTDTMAVEAVDNPAVSAPGGAGIQAAQFVVGQGVQAVITGNVGPNAMGVLQAANVPVYLNRGGTVGQAAQAFKENKLQQSGGASVADHSGLSYRPRGGGGGRRAAGRGFGGEVRSPVSPQPSGREAEIETLRVQAAEMRQQLATLLERIEGLEKEK